MGFLSWLFGRASSHEGASAAQAIVVGGVGEEYAWIKQHCPGFIPRMQSLQEISGKPYDVHVIRNGAGEEREVYFDISQFFGE